MLRGRATDGAVKFPQKFFWRNCLRMVPKTGNTRGGVAKSWKNVYFLIFFRAAERMRSKIMGAVNPERFKKGNARRPTNQIQKQKATPQLKPQYPRIDNPAPRNATKRREVWREIFLSSLPIAFPRFLAAGVAVAVVLRDRLRASLQKCNQSTIENAPLLRYDALWRLLQ